MPKLDRVQLDPGQTVTGEQANRIQENIERALGGLASSFTETIRIVTGGGSGNGLAGMTPLDLGQHILGSDQGSEDVLRQWQVQSGAFGDTIRFGLSAQFKSASGTAFFRLRLGGTDYAANGTVVLAAPSTDVNLTGKLVTSQGPSPGGTQRLKLTNFASSALGSLAQIADGYAGISAPVTA